MLDHAVVAGEFAQSVSDLTKYIKQARDIVHAPRREPADTQRLARLHTLIDESLSALNYNAQRYCQDIASEAKEAG